MIIKKIFKASGTSVQKVGADLNRQIKEELIASGLFELLSEEIGNGEQSKYTLKHVHSDYKLSFQSGASDYQAETSVELLRGTMAPITAKPGFGSASNATLYIHILVSGESLAFKMLDCHGNIVIGGSCLRYVAFTGEKGYIYNQREGLTTYGLMGRGTTDDITIFDVSYSDQRSLNYAVLQEKPLIYQQGEVIGYYLDVVTINADFLTKNANYFCLYNLDGIEYYGGLLAANAFGTAPYTAIAMKG